MRFRLLCKHYARRDDGASAVEFAIISPLFILVLVGILAYGLYFGAAHSVQQLAADAARASVGGLSPAERQAIALAQVDAGAESYPLLRRDMLTVTADPGADPNLFEVHVIYDATHLGIWGLSGLIPLPSPVIERSAAIRRGGY